MTPTGRLYYNDAYLRSFEAQVVGVEGNRVYLDQTAFYPSSGGQPNDTGRLAGIAVEDVVDEGGRIAHVLTSSPQSGVVRGEVDWTRRFDHMQQHSGQHLLSAVLAGLFEIQTVSFHLGSDASTIDVATDALNADQVASVEERVNGVVFENRPIHVDFASNSGDLGLRKATDREGEVRIVSIEGLDRSACGGTHVRSTAEIGPVLVRKLDKIRGNVRVEFLCGMRAVRRARADYEALLKIARRYSSSLDDAPGMVAAQSERFQEVDKAYRKLAVEAAQRSGRDLYSAMEPDERGLRRVVRQARIDDELRAQAQGFTAGAKAVFIAVCEDPPSILAAASKDSGLHAGEWVKALVTANGGKGGGSPVLGQGSVPTLEALQRVKAMAVGHTPA